jgi:hypothetical protein
MGHDDLPEISFGYGLGQIRIRGKEALRAAGWAVRFLLVARGSAPWLMAAGSLLATWWHG